MMQLSLYDWRTVAPPRPKMFDEVIAQKIAEDMRSEIAMICLYDQDDPDLDRAVNDVASAISCSDDPYTICKYLDDVRHWDVDGELLSLMSEVWHRRKDIHTLEIKNWVSENGVVPNFSVGQSINVTKSLPLHTIELSGIIESIDLEQAKYRICCADGSFRMKGNLMTVNFESVTC